MKRAPCFGSVTSVAVPLVFQVVSPDLNHAASFTEGTGTQACVAPCALPRSSRVTTSKSRHLPGFGANAACAFAIRGIATATESAALPFNTSRRSNFTVRPPGEILQEL